MTDEELKELVASNTQGIIDLRKSLDESFKRTNKAIDRTNEGVDRTNEVVEQLA